MHKFKIIVILLSLGLANMQAQGFRKKHFLPNTISSACRDVIEAPNGNLIAIGISADSTLGSYVLTVLGMDPFGNPLWKKSYVGNGVLYFDNSFHLRGPVLQDTSGFYHALTAWDGVNPRAFGVLLRFNYNGDTLWQKKYKSADTLEDVMLQGMCRSVDGGLLFTGNFQYWGAAAWLKCLVLKTDKEGNELWRKKISKALPDVQDGRSIVQDSASKKIIIAGFQYIGSATNYGSYGSVVLADSLGNKLNQFAYNNYNGDAFMEVIQLRDKSFIVSGSQNANNPLGPNKRYFSHLTRFDSSGNVIWTKKYNDASVYNSALVLQQLSNNNILVGGALDTMFNKNVPPIDSIPMRIKVLMSEINPITGAIVRQRFVGSSLKMFTGESPRSLRPTNDGGFVMAIQNIDGNPPLPFNIIKIDANLCDTSDAYCREQDEVGIKESGDGNVYLRIFPNPASNQIFISTNKVLDEIIVSNLLGAKVLHHVLDGSNKTAFITTSALSNGIYFIEIISNGSSLTKEKLIIAHN